MKTMAHHLAVALVWATTFAGLAQPVIIDQPNSLTNLVGTTATFTVAANGASPLNYQWHLVNGFPLLSSTNSTLVLSNVQSYQAGNYFVVITNSDGAVTSVVAALTVLTPPSITGQPRDQAASLFADTRFSVVAAGDQPLSYQWRLNANGLPGMTNTSLAVTNIQRVDAGNYDVVVTNLSGSVTSKVATLTIVPFNSIYCFGFSWTATSGLDPSGSSCGWDPPLYYQHRASNGPLWPEYLSTNLELAYVGANNYAACGATALDTENQVSSFRAPPKPQLSAYFLWLGGGVSESLTDMLVNSNAVSRLYAKGARTIVVESQFYLTPGAIQYCAPSDTTFNASFLEAMNSFSQSKPDVRILFIDMCSHFSEVLMNPAQYGFTKVDIDALSDTNLTDKSFGGPGANYLLWNPLHGTTKLHELMASWHLAVLNNSRLETVEMNLSSAAPVLRMNHLQIGRDYTLQSSSDLAHWSDIQIFTAAAGTNQWTDHPDGMAPAFYRLEWQP